MKKKAFLFSDFLLTSATDIEFFFKNITNPNLVKEEYDISDEDLDKIESLNKIFHSLGEKGKKDSEIATSNVSAFTHDLILSSQRFNSLLAQSLRDVTVTLEPIAGGITMFYAFIDGKRVIQDDGSKKQSWSGKVPNEQVKIKIRVTGIGKAEYKLGIDLPGTVDDKSLPLKLEGGYHEIEILL